MKTTYLIRDWNLNLIGAIQAESCDEAQTNWEGQAANGRTVLATRATAERLRKLEEQGWR